MVDVNQALGRFSLPGCSPFFQILAGKLLENEAAEDVVAGGLVEIIRRTDIIFRVSMLERHAQLHRLAIALDAKRDNIAGVSVGSEQICKFDLPVKWIDIVAVLVDLVVRNRCHDVTYLQPGFHCGRIRLYFRNVNPASFSCFSGELAQFRIACGKKRKTRRRKTAIILALSFFQKVRDDRCGDGVEQLRTRIIAE